MKTMKKYFVLTNEGYIKTSTALEAIEVLNEISTALEAIEIDESELPEDVRAEDALYSCDGRTVIAKKG
jgi:hypothetical protein